MRINVNKIDQGNEAKYEGYFDFEPILKTNRIRVTMHMVGTFINKTSNYSVGGDYEFRLYYFTNKKNPDDPNNQETWSGSGLYRTDVIMATTSVPEQIIPAGQNYSITFDGTKELIPFKDGVLHLYDYTMWGMQFEGGITFDCGMGMGIDHPIVNPNDDAEKVTNGHIKINNNWKYAFPWRKTNGQWQRCRMWKKISDIWKKGK